MPRKPYTRYSREFKLEAVRQAALGEKPKAQIARALGIRVGHLRDWRLQFEEEARTGVTHPPPAVGQDLEQLRRENAKLKVENEILKKAAADSTGRRNSLMKSLSWCFVVQCLSGPFVEAPSDRIELGLRIP